MGTRVITECDMCNDEPKDGDMSEWSNVTIERLVSVAPPMQQPGVVQPAMGMEVPPGEPRHSTALICHKPSCLTKWAKEQNDKKAKK